MIRSYKYKSVITSRTKIVPSVDGRFGVKTDNGSFNGVIGMVHRGEAFAGINCLSLTRDRAEAADFLTPMGKFE